jgi:hypothetical protein
MLTVITQYEKFCAASTEIYSKELSHINHLDIFGVYIFDAVWAAYINVEFRNRAWITDSDGDTFGVRDAPDAFGGISHFARCVKATITFNIARDIILIEKQVIFYETSKATEVK